MFFFFELTDDNDNNENVHSSNINDNVSKENDIICNGNNKTI